jgi:phage terminase large subunit-like protein
MTSSMKADRQRRPIWAVWHQQDPGSAGLDSAMATNRMLAKLKFTALFETVSGSKEVRAGPWSSALQGGGVRLVRGGWNEAYIEEHVAFPKGKYDDQEDWSSWGYSKLIELYELIVGESADEVVIYDERVNISEF